MWRAVLRSIQSSGLKPLTSAAILVSKPSVSKCVIQLTPETPSTRFDQTVSTSLPIGVTKPMPVTATRRPLECEFIASKTTDLKAYLQQWKVGKGPRNFGHGVPFCYADFFRGACAGRAPAGAAAGWPGRRGRRRAAP